MKGNVREDSHRNDKPEIHSDDPDRSSCKAGCHRCPPDELRRKRRVRAHTNDAISAVEASGQNRPRRI